MRSLGLAVAILCLAGVSVAGGPPSDPGQRFKIVPAHARLGPGERIQFRITHGQADAEIRWGVEGRGCVARDGAYRAPYIIAAQERATITAVRGPRAAPEFDQAIVELIAGVFPGAEDCLGAGQQWESGGCTLNNPPVDELPEAVTRVPPRYPPSVRARGLEGSLIVQAIVCRSGRVLDASAQWGQNATPTPELAELATEAARQWVFKPGLSQGLPVATVVAIPFQFPPP